MQETTTDLEVTLGTTIYDDQGNPLGTVRGFDDDGFYVSIAEELSIPSSQGFVTGIAGEAVLTWRCYECGAIGDIEAVPEDHCPDCGAAKENIYYQVQD